MTTEAQPKPPTVAALREELARYGERPGPKATKAMLAEQLERVRAEGREPVVPPTPEDAERQARDTSPPEPEVRPEEFTQGTGPSVGASFLAAEVVEALRAPLDPARVRSRKGRGRGTFEYIAGHDAKRRANELFGFGNWGSEVLEVREEATVPVVSDNGKDGWHIAYRALVRVTVRDCLPVSDVGYGDGVEYGPAAAATARELAMKEAVTDAMKRALTQYGDQFGLVLYAKDDERKRIDRDRSAEDARPAPPYVQQQAGRVEVPRNVAEISVRLAERLGAEEAAEWLRQAVVEYAAANSLGVVERWADLPNSAKNQLGQKLAGVVLDFEQREADTGEDLRMSEDVRDKTARVFAAKLDGLALVGPPWRLDPGEMTLPTREEYEAGDGDYDEQLAKAAWPTPPGSDDIEFPDAPAGDAPDEGNGA